MAGPHIDSSDVAAFFDAFAAAFSSFDGLVIAERYAEPFLACGGDGAAQVFADRVATGAYFQGFLDLYAEAGARTCSHRELDVTDAGGRHVLAMLTWDLSAADGRTVMSWRESYVLVAEADQLLVRSSINHAP